MPLDKKAINNLQKVLAKEPDVLAAYLFGSQIAKEAKPNSDLDLAIVVKDRAQKEEFYFLKRLSSLPLPNLDLVVVDPKNSSPFLLHQIVKKGLPIYEKSERERVSFQAQAASKFFDTQHFRNIQNFYLEKRLKEDNYGY